MTMGPAPMTRIDETSVRLGRGLRVLREGFRTFPSGGGRLRAAGLPGGIAQGEGTESVRR